MAARFILFAKGSVTQAAVMMGRQQPAVTHQIKCLEKELGATLFDRSSGKMKLTPEGRVLFEKAISLFEVVKEIRSEFGKEQPEYEGKIIIATSHVIMDFYLPR
jgi:DNA-binding transcriptional LysR family regulator